MKERQKYTESHTEIDSLGSKRLNLLFSRFLSQEIALMQFSQKFLQQQRQYQELPNPY